MSERGSFVTEYIYCADCLAAAKKALYADDKEAGGLPLETLWATTVPSWQEGETLPIIAGRIGASYAGGELHEFEWDVVPALEKVICHPLRIAVLAEHGEQIFTAQPKTPK